MSEEERAEMLHRISALLPTIVFTQFTMVLTQIQGTNHDALIHAIDGICRNTGTTFTYRMNADETADKITPIREALDLLEGWILTSSYSMGGRNRIEWTVASIVGKVAK